MKFAVCKSEFYHVSMRIGMRSEKVVGSFAGGMAISTRNRRSGDSSGDS